MAKRGGVWVSHTSQRRSQAGTELIIILAVLLIIMAVMVALNTDISSYFNSNLREEKSKLVVNELGQAAEYVYQQGHGAQTRVLSQSPAALPLRRSQTRR
jgi:glucan phosphoethanolaminetransferase (alkaline phosphatase superfamily)